MILQAIGESGSRFSNTNISESLKPKSKRLERYRTGSVRELSQSDLCKNIGKAGSWPSPYKLDN